MSGRFVDPLSDLGPLLLNVDKPARYTGGEYGRLSHVNGKMENCALKTVIAFPDLYEIGMSNQALKILYKRLNGLEDIACDRVFAPAPDFAELLSSKGLPLYGLDSGISLKDVDLLMFTLGYELGITGILSMLDLSGIPLRSSARTENDPVLILGGPCVSNPLPYSLIIDAFWIGEAEGGFFELASELAEIKKSGGGRAALIARLSEHPSVWVRGKEKARRAVDSGFASRRELPALFPIPSMKVVHHHGAVEIMRGCPNGCRFCHAGYWYRPMRQKAADIIEAETEAFVSLGGFREITLSSLSSGDYQYLDSLVDALNGKFRKRKISFQLPSLKVSSFSLKLLDKISTVRKSGLTFAVETPLEFWQMAINKRVSGEDIDSILAEAKRHGWRGAKFYFMIGLPVGEDPPAAAEGRSLSEADEIAAFIERAAKKNRMHFNINVGTFVPKAHTPFERSAQLRREAAERTLNDLRNRLKPQGHKVGIQDPLVSVLEGIVSRGDERAGEIFEEAYRLGCRLDAWSEYFKRELWTELLGKHKDLVDEFLGRKDPGETLPWSCIDSRVADNYFADEAEKSRAGEITSPCIENCNNPCGACGKEVKTVWNIIQSKDVSQAKTPVLPEESPAESSGSALQEESPQKKPDPHTHRILFSFSKQGSAVFHSHLGVLEIFSMAFIRGSIPVLYSQGFNPLPRLEIASPLSLGMRARGEIAVIETESFFAAEDFKRAFNASLPEGFEIVDAMNVFIPSGTKKRSVSSLLWGYAYEGKNGGHDLVAAREEKAYRESRLAATESLLSLERLQVLAGKNNDPVEPLSYFEVYRALYPDTNISLQ